MASNFPASIDSITLPDFTGTLGQSTRPASAFLTDMRDAIRATETAVASDRFVNVTDYGAIGSDTTDDRAAIQAAIDSLPAGGGTVYLPPGTYRTAGAIVVNADGVQLLGASPTASTISYSGTGAAVVYGAKANTTWITGCSITDLGIKGTSTGVIGLHWIGVQNSQVRNVRVQDFTGATATGVVWDTASVSPSFTGCRNNVMFGGLLTNNTNGFKLTKDAADTGTDGCNNNTVYGLRVAFFTGVGVNINAGEGNAFYGCDASTTSNGTTGFRVDDDVCSLFQARADNSFGAGNTAIGIRLTANARDHLILQPTGNGPTTPIQYDDPTVNGVVIRSPFNASFGNQRRSIAATGADTWTARAWRNAGSSTISVGEVAYFDSTCAEGEVKRVNSTAARPNPMVAVETVAANAVGGFAEAGSVVTVQCDTGAVAVGDTLVTSLLSDGNAHADNTTTNPRLIIGVARTSKGSGSNGNVRAYIR